MNTAPVLIPVAAGKGGVGKSFIAANLAMALAARGHRTLAVDLDLGGSNLYTFLGLANRFAGVGDFLISRNAALADLAVDTPTDGLKYIPGDGRTPFMGNLHHARKQKLIRHIRRLPAEFIVLDLGAGTTYNTLDFFSMTPNGLLVTSTDYLSIMNLLVFAKNMLLRCFDQRLAPHRSARNRLRRILQNPTDRQVPSVAELHRQIADQDRQAAEVMAAVCRQVRPRVVFNLGADPQEIQVASQIDKSMADILSLQVDYFGFVPDDPDVRRSVHQRSPFLPGCPQSPAAGPIERLAERVLKFWSSRIDRSAERLMQSESRHWH